MVLKKKSYIGLVFDFMKNNHDIEGIKIEIKKKQGPFFYIYKRHYGVYAFLVNFPIRYFKIFLLLVW
jgi:hypothetical protein